MASQLASQLPMEPLPRCTVWAIRWFWLIYWFWFFVWLPWMLIRQVFVCLGNLSSALATWNRVFEVIDGLDLIYLNSFKSLAASVVYGERFMAIRYHDTLIDPGAVFGLDTVSRYARDHGPFEAILVTHAHEEHIGNALALSERLEVPVHGTQETLQALRTPQRLSFSRRSLMGQPEGGVCSTCLFESHVRTSQITLEVIPSPGHCDGHASLYDPSKKVLFVGDSFLHTIFTSPNADVSTHEWIATLERYCRLDVDTMVGTHGHVYTCDPRVELRSSVARWRRPKELFEDKLTFLRWAVRVVEEGEARGLPYSVIEASLFPWGKPWSSRNWFGDESVRLLSGGEFSRTHFVRSLSSHPEAVPVRFPFLARLGQKIAHCLPRP